MDVRFVLTAERFGNSGRALFWNVQRIMPNGQKLEEAGEVRKEPYRNNPEERWRLAQRVRRSR